MPTALYFPEFATAENQPVTEELTVIDIALNEVLFFRQNR